MIWYYRRFCHVKTAGYFKLDTTLCPVFCEGSWFTCGLYISAHRVLTMLFFNRGCNNRFNVTQLCHLSFFLLEFLPWLKGEQVLISHWEMEPWSSAWYVKIFTTTVQWNPLCILYLAQMTVLRQLAKGSSLNFYRESTRGTILEIFKSNSKHRNWLSVVSISWN